MANEIYHRSNWGNAVNDIAWGDTYEKFDATNEMFVRSDNYENSNETDKLMAAINPKPSILLTPTAYDNGSLHSVKPLQTLGSELVTNGDFATDSDWTLDSGWSISNGKLLGTLSSSANAYQSEALEAGKIYQITYEISNYSQGGVRFQLAGGGGTVSGTSNLSNGVFTETLKATVNHTSIRFRSLTTDGGFTASIDNVSVKEVINADFDFSRPTTGSATGIGSRENSSGNIESVAADLPRIDYLGGTGHILLEPQSTNLYDYSQDFTQVYWNKTNVTVSTSTITDPAGGQNSFKLVPDSGTGGNRSLGRNFTGLSGLHTQTVFAKKGEYNYIMLRTRNAPITAVMFDLENGTFNVNLTSAAFDSAKIEDYGNGWFRCSMTLDPSQMAEIGRIYTSFSVGITGSETSSFNGDGTSGIYIFGAQFEELSFPTSYIPTSGSTSTRNADAANNAGSSDLINSTEGVLYAEIGSINQILAQPMFISLSNSTINNTVEIGFGNGNNLARFRVRSNSGLLFAQNISVSDITQFTKMAIKYKSGDIKVFINGSQVYSNTTSFSFSDNLIELAFDRGNDLNGFEGKVKCIAVFKEALTDEELTALTT